MCSPFARTCSVAPREFAVFIKVSNRHEYRIAQRALHNPAVSSAAFSGLRRSPTPVAPALLQLCEKLVGWHKKRVFLQQPPDNQHRMRFEDVH